MSFLQCARDVVVQDLVRHPATGSEDEARDRRYVRKARGVFYETLRQIIGLEVAKRAVEFSIGLRKMSVKTL
jgi:hypothetical protein